MSLETCAFAFAIKTCILAILKPQVVDPAQPPTNIRMSKIVVGKPPQLLKSDVPKPVPVIITVYKDKKFDFVIKSPPASHFIKEAMKLKSGSKEPGRVIAGSITMKQAEAIAKEKMKDLNAFDIKEATKIICGSARSMGLK